MSVTLRRWGVAAVATATLSAGLPLLLTLSPVSAQETACPDPSASPSASASPAASPSPDPHASASPSSQPSASPSAAPCVTPSPSATASPSTSPSATPSATATATVSPSPSASPTPAPLAPRLGISVSPSFVTPGIASVVTIGGRAGTPVELYAYSRPSTEYRLVRQGIVPDDGTLELPVTPGTNTRLFAAVTGQTGNESISVVVNVRTALSLSVRRVGVRSYVFEGRLLPRNQATLVSLYRVDSNRREILTGQATSDPSNDSIYRIPRKFTGSGRFNFVARTSQTLINAPGLSNVRPTLIF